MQEVRSSKGRMSSPAFTIAARPGVLAISPLSPAFGLRAAVLTGSRVSGYYMNIPTIPMMGDYEEDLDDFPVENRERTASRRVDRSMDSRKWNRDEDSSTSRWINVLV